MAFLRVSWCHEGATIHVYYSLQTQLRVPEFSDASRCQGDRAATMLLPPHPGGEDAPHPIFSTQELGLACTNVTTIPHQYTRRGTYLLPHDNPMLTLTHLGMNEIPSRRSICSLHVVDIMCE